MQEPPNLIKVGLPKKVEAKAAMGFGKDGKGVIVREQHSIGLSTLAGQTALKFGTQIAIGEDFRIIKTEFTLHYEGHTLGEGPLTVGIADNELSVADIGETLILDGPTDRNDNSGNEQAMRPVWELAQVSGETASGRVPSSGLWAEKTLRWTFSNPEGWTWYAWNGSGTPLAGGMNVIVRAKHFGVWVT